MIKKIVTSILLTGLIAAGCNYTQPSMPLNNSQLQQKYSNTKFGYSLNYPTGYLVETYATTEVGYDLPNTPAAPDSNPVMISKKESPSWINVQAHPNSLPLNENNVATGFAIKPKVSSVIVAGISGYKLTFTDTPYEMYYVQKPNNTLFQIKIAPNDTISKEMMESFSFNQ